MSKILIIVEGGVIQQVYSNDSTTEVIVADYDNPSFGEYDPCFVTFFNNLTKEVEEEIQRKKND